MLLPGLASSGLTSNRHSLLVRVNEVQGYQGGQVVPAYTKRIRPVQVTPSVIAVCARRWRKATTYTSVTLRAAVVDYKPRNNHTVADERRGDAGPSTDLQSLPSSHRAKEATRAYIGVRHPDTKAHG